MKAVSLRKVKSRRKYHANGGLFSLILTVVFHDTHLTMLVDCYDDDDGLFVVMDDDGG